MNYLNYITPSSRILIKNSRSYKLATFEEVEQLNQYSDIIKHTAYFYEENLSNTKIDYVYKENSSIKVLPVKYKKENFPHLTGINFDKKSANEKFEYLKKGNNTTPIIIERGLNTFKKLNVLYKIPNLIKANSTVLTELKNIKQAQNLRFTRGIKDSTGDLLLALQNFEPEFYTPKSLLNIENSEEYKNIPENTLLGVFKEKDIENGVKIEPISLNKDSLDNLAITTEMLIGMKKYANELGKSRQKEKASEEAKKREQYRRYLAQRGLNR